MKSRLCAAVAIGALLSAALPVVTSAVASPNAPAVTAVPRPDHVVIVIEENHSGTEVVGSPNAPYISSLAANNANFTQSYAVTHPSEPNYLALFSGSTQGLTDDSCPHSYAAPSLGDRLIGAGQHFTGYSETMPSAGYTGCQSGNYARKHNPWVNFPAIPAASNQPFTAFPSDYSTLPDVSIVVPNLQDDMHDGTVAQGDTWLQNNMSGYVTWAKQHNSLFILTFDEDDNTAANRIPTVFAGARVAPGSYDETISHYNVLRTIEDAYGVAPVGASSTATPILDVWTGAPNGDPKPTAAFTSSCQGASCTFNGSGSSDDTSVASWSWDFGDSSSASGSSVSHTYQASGTYQVTLRVTDDQGAVSDPVTHPVTVTVAGGAPFASDSFARTVSNGWGSAPVGGAWSTTGSAFSVAPGAASIRLATAGSQLGEYLPAVARTDADVLAAMALDKVPVGGPVYLNVQGRRVSANNEYDAKVLVNADRSVTVRVIRLVGNVETAVAGPVTVPGVVYAAGMVVDVRVQVTGTSPTTVRARAWAATGSEPATWQVSGTDATAALQAAGSVGVTGYLSSKATNAPVTVRYSSLTAQPTTAQANHAPTAAFTFSCLQLSCSFSSTGSSDSDGSVTGWAWNFGDGSTGTGASTQHAFVLAGTYQVSLIVTDNQGAASSPVSHSVPVTAPPPNQPPAAAFTFSCQALVCSFDGTGSTDDEGVETWSWDFGDGKTGTGSTVSHTFSTADTYAVQLTVSDDDDATDAVSHSVTVTGSPPVNQKPTAVFTSSCTQLSCTFSGTDSSDPDGTVATWAWTFGDGATGTGSSSQHSYTGTGTYPVTLTVTDNQGLPSDPVTNSVSVTAPAGTAFVSDSFARTVSNGWGSAPVGGAWTTSGSASQYSVTPGAAAMRLGTAGAQPGALVSGVTRTDADVMTAVALDKVPVGGPVYLSVRGRRVGTSEYDAKVLVNANGSVTVRVVRLVGTTETLLAGPVTVPGVVYTAGMVLNIRLQVTGTSPTTVRARAWAASGTEPTTWQVSSTDSTAALQAAGSVGVIVYLSSAATNAPVTVRFSSFTAKPTAG